MGKIFERLKKNRDNKGMSFVEVLCAVAILGLVSGVIGGVITVSTRTYRKGISETSVQQEAQLAANTISNVVKDAYTVVYAAASGGNYYKDGVELVDDSGAAVTNGNDYTELSLTTNSSTQYSFFHYPSDGRLLYGEYDVSTGSAVLQGNQELMASNITAFTADTSDFADNRTITLEMTVKDDSTGREIPMTYTMKSRNESGTGVAYAAVTPIAQVYAEDVVLVPGETYDIPITVYGTANAPNVGENTGSSGLTINSVTTDYVSVTLDTADSLSVDYYTLYITTQETGDDGITPVGTATCNVYVRQVMNVAVSVSSDVSGTANGLLEETNAVYTFAAAVTGNNLAKQVATDYDKYYMTAQAVTWSWTLTANGTTTAYTSGGAADGSFSWQDAGGYVEFAGCTEVGSYPQIKFTALQDLPSDFSLTVTATSNHADGYNKANHADNNDYTYQRSGSDYADVSGEKTLTSRDAKVSGGFEITLEPNETGTVSLSTLGGTTDMDLVISGNTDAATAASYDVSTDEVTIKLGNDEKGSGASEDTVTGNPYTFVIYVYPQGKANVASSLLTTVIVHVRRIDVMSIMVFDNWLSEDGKSALTTPTYDFRGRINVSNGVTDDTLLTYLYDDNTVVPETLSTKISWALKNKSGTIVKSDSVVCMATVGTTSNSLSNIYDGTTGKTVSKISNYDTDYYSFQGIKHPRVQTDSDGNYYLKQMPEIDVSFGKSGADTVSGLPDGWTFTVTMEMLHPLGTYTYSGSTITTNKTGIAYGTASDSVTLTGEAGISVAKNVVYAEPGQGTEDSKDDSDEELIIPIIAEGAVYKMSVSISGNSSSATRISNYPETDVDRYGNVNPYLASNATSADNTRTWYLGMKIGTDEVGSNKDGLITVTVTAYNAKDAAIASADFTIAIRRVNKVSVKAAGASSLSSLNAEGQEITLEAYPTGYGTDGIEYYAMQTDDDGNTCRWETENHGEYKTPYTMEWRMYYDGKEKALGEWTEYFSNISTAVSESSHKATTTFTLLQELPSGAKIRAYSLHSYGSYDNLGDSIDDSSVSGTTKYNKSGKDYGGVYGEISLGATYEIVSDFKRGDENYFGNTTFASIRSTYFSDAEWGSSQSSFFRYKVSGTEWTDENSQYYIMDDHSATIAHLTGTQGSLLFLPTESYDIEIVNVVYGTRKSTGEKYIYYPLDESLLDCGWGDEGYQLWDGSWYGYGYNATSCAELYATLQDSADDAYRYYRVPESEIYFEPYTGSSYQTIDSTAQTVGSSSSPISLTYETNYNTHFAVTLAPTYFNITKTQEYFAATIDKLNDSTGKWEEMIALSNNKSLDENTYYWFMNVSLPSYDIYHVRSNASGTYRIRATVTNMTWNNISGTLFSPVYKGYTVDSLDLYDLDTEAGIMYIKLN